ncbi:MAG: metallophosphoesterase [Eubacterium sp.]|nr:metallophosphoesterase [Eubacterium sp.]
MRVLIISDTHGIQKNLDRVLEQERPYGQVIHLGDIEGDEDYLEAAAGCPVAAVRGNNDYFSDLPQEQIIEVAGKRIFLTHGHYYYVAAGVEHLIKEAQGRGADLVMFGHTHRPLIRQEGNLYVINPGSLSYPRQEGRKPSYIVMETGFANDLKFFLKFL